MPNTESFENSLQSSKKKRDYRISLKLSFRYGREYEEKRITKSRAEGL
jgi:hypothetical protein